MDMLFAYPVSIKIIAALLAAVMVIFGGTRCVARRAYVRARRTRRQGPPLGLFFRPIPRRR
jgi:hypothetical protein